MKRLWLHAVACAALFVSIANADLSVTLEPSSSRIWLHGNGEEIPAVILRSSQGYLVPGSADDPGPFQEVLTNLPDEIAYTMLGSRFTLEGSFQLPAGWDRDHQADFNERHLAVDAGIVADVEVIPIIRGDFDTDGMLGLADIDLLSAVIATRDDDNDVFDLTDDGAVNLQDLHHFLTLADRLNGDADFDGRVQFPDFTILAQHFSQPAVWSQGDFDATGRVQFADLLVLANNFGQSSTRGIAVVPEPSGWVLAVLGLFVLPSWRRTPGRCRRV